MTTLLSLPPVPDRRLAGRWIADGRHPQIDVAGRNAPGAWAGARAMISRKMAIIGATNQLAIPSSALIDDMPAATIALWAQFPTMSLYRLVLKDSIPNISNGAWAVIGNSNGTVAFQKSYSALTHTVTSATNLIKANGQFFHIAVAFTNSGLGSDVRIYINGIERGYSSRPDASGARRSDAGLALYIGSPTATGARIRDVQMYPQALSPRDIFRIFAERRDGVLLPAAAGFRWWWAGNNNVVCG